MTTPATANADTPAMPATTHRLDILTGLRWWAALWVFVYHLQALVNIPAPWVFPIGYGHFGVTFFFVLSGFVLTWSWNRRVKVSTFYVRRFARIWPAHLVALLLAVPVFYSLAPSPQQSWVKEFDLGVLSLSVPVVQGWSRQAEVLFSGNPAAWTLTCEFFFYAIHPLLMRALSRWRVVGALTILVSIWVASVLYRILVQHEPSAWWSTQMPLPIVHAPEFIIGMSIAWALRCGWQPRLTLWPSVTVFGTGLLALVALARRPEAPGASTLSIFTGEWMAMLCAVVITGAAVSSLSGVRSWLASPLLVRLGAWSFAFYLVHATVIYAVRSVAGVTSGLPGALIAFGVFWVALGASALLYRLVEHPAEQRIRSWKDARDRATAHVDVA